MLKSMTFRCTLAVACAISMSAHAIADSPIPTVPIRTSALPPPQTRLQEVVVTAQKREERLLDVPIPVSVVDTSSLTVNNQVKLTDFYSEVPGLSIAPSTMSSQTISIRGHHDRCSGIRTTQPITDRRRHRRRCALRRCRRRGSACA